MARRGFWAEMQRQARLAERERVRAARTAQRNYQAARRETERAHREAERAAAQLARATAQQRKLLEKQAKELYLASMLAEVEERNLELAQIDEDLNLLLAATLNVDDYVDLAALRKVVSHPPFEHAALEQSIPRPPPIEEPAAPIYVPPPPPNWFWRLFGPGRQIKAVAKAEALHEQALLDWKQRVDACIVLREKAEAEHIAAERERLKKLAMAQARYESECAARHAEVLQHNEAIERFMSDLAYGVPAAVQEYVGIVLSNSVYPEHFPVEHEFQFDPNSAELQLRVLVPGPSKMSDTKAFKFTKSSDEITSTQLSQKERRERYADAIAKVALRSFHEVFEADRRSIIKTISLELGTETLDPATGHHRYVPFVAAAAERSSFLGLDLANVVPEATLARLGATVSKNPFGLIAIDPSGIRRA